MARDTDPPNAYGGWDHDGHPDNEKGLAISPELVALGIAFYDAQRGHGAADHHARHSTVAYMRRKELEPFSPDAMPYHEALADALAKRAAERIAGAEALSQLAPQGGRQ